MLILPMMTTEAAHMVLEQSQYFLSSSTNLHVISLFELPICVLISDKNNLNYPLLGLKSFIFVKLGGN